jgi:endoglucanase
VHDPFGSAASVTDYDAVSHELGLIATAELYRQVTGSHAYDAFADRQRDWVFGANAWGTSFVIGEGTTYPLCPQHQVANLAGSLTGGAKVAVGAVVNGPNGSDQFTDLGVPDGARACPADGIDRFKAFDTKASTFLDEVAAWPSDEPADDFTASGILAYALGR